MKTAGMSTRQLRNFAMEYGENLQGKTTRQVVEMIKEKTREHRCSYIDWLVAIGRGSDVTTANMLVSHAWDGMFLDLIGALELKFGKNPSCRFWIDIFVLVQSEENEAYDVNEAEDSLDTFEILVNEIGHVVVILTPFECPHFVMRSWCLYELSLALRDDLEVSVSISPSQRKRFLEYLNGGGDFMRLYNVRAENATAKIKADQDMLSERMRMDTGGLPGFNERAMECLRDWVFKEARKAFNGLAKDVRTGGELQCNLGIVLLEKGQLQDATAMLEECGKMRNIRAFRALGALYHRQGMTSTALNAYAALLDLSLRAAGPWNAQAASAFHDAGDLLFELSMFSDALLAHQKALQILQAGSADTIVQQAVQLHKVGSALLKMGRLAETLAHIQEAQRIYSDVLQRRDPLTDQQALPAADTVETADAAAAPVTIHDHSKESLLANTLCTAGLVYHRLGRHSEALRAFEDALTLLLQQAGLAELATVTAAEVEAGGGWGDLTIGGTCLRVALFYQRLGRYPEALAHFKAALRARIAVHGPTHGDIAQLLSGMARVYQDCGQLVEALTQHEEALRQWQALTGGKDHVAVAAVLSELAEAHLALNQADIALTRAAEAKEMFSRVLTRKHPRTVQAARYFDNLSRPVAAREAPPRQRRPASTSKRAAAGALKGLLAEMARAANSIGRVLCEEGRCAEALARHEEALAMRLEALGPEHPDVAATLADAAAAHCGLGQEEAALERCIEAHEVFERVLGPDHHLTIDAARLLYQLAPPPGTEVDTVIQADSEIVERVGGAERREKGKVA